MPTRTLDQAEIPETPVKQWETFIAQRQRRGHNQKEAGTILGASQSTVSDWETLKRCPDIRDIPRLARYLRLTRPEVLEEILVNFLPECI